jgi:hypothetical protein
MSDSTPKYQFAIVGIRTEQFAILREEKDLNIPIEVQAGFKVGGDLEKHMVSVNPIIRFMYGQETLLLLECGCHFLFTEETWERCRNSDGHIQIPKDLLTHLGVIALGTVRGILHAKTEGSVYNHHVLPPLNLTEVFKDDLLLNQI